MSKATVEDRLDVLEKALAELVARSKILSPGKDWRTTIGMFANDPVIKEIQEEGRNIREAERLAARREAAEDEK